MQSKRQNSSSKTRERKLEAMKLLKNAYQSAAQSGLTKSYKISV